MGKKVIHYAMGYGGHLNYHTICEKEIHSHSDIEDATLHPEDVDCAKCKATKIWTQDYQDFTVIDKTIKRRIYLESDVLSESELRSAQRDVARLCDNKKLKYIRRVFSDVLDYAWHDLDKTWKAVKLSDEIYSNSSLFPLSGGSYIGAPVIFNGMCERAISENVTGKDVYILRNLKDIDWDMIKIPIMQKAFKKNNLFMYNDEFDIVKIDVTKIKK